MHGAALEEAMLLRDRIQQELEPVEMILPVRVQFWGRMQDQVPWQSPGITSKVFLLSRRKTLVGFLPGAFSKWLGCGWRRPYRTIEPQEVIMLSELKKYVHKPALYAPSPQSFGMTSISQRNAHRPSDPKVDSATRNHAFIERSADWIAQRLPPSQFHTCSI
jgi:hypothetical protein